MWQAGATLHCGAQASHCGGFSRCRAQVPGMWASVVVVHKLSSCVHGLSCPTACGIVPDQELNPCPLHWRADSYPLYHHGSPVCLSKSRTFSLLFLPHYWQEGFLDGGKAQVVVEGGGDMWKPTGHITGFVY